MRWEGFFESFVNNRHFLEFHMMTTSQSVSTPFTFSIGYTVFLQARHLSWVPAKKLENLLLVWTWKGRMVCTVIISSLEDWSHPIIQSLTRAYKWIEYDKFQVQPERHLVGRPVDSFWSTWRGFLRGLSIVSNDRQTIGKGYFGTQI